MSCDFRIFVVVKGELRTRGHIGVKTRKKYRLGESYVALMLLLCSSYSGRELKGGINGLRRIGWTSSINLNPHYIFLAFLELFGISKMCAVKDKAFRLSCFKLHLSAQIGY